MKENITADWARKTSETLINEKINKQIETCLDAIEMSVNRNEFNCSVCINPDSLTIKEITKRGFSTKYISGGYGEGYLNISW